MLRREHAQRIGHRRRKHKQRPRLTRAGDRVHRHRWYGAQAAQRGRFRWRSEFIPSIR